MVRSNYSKHSLPEHQTLCLMNCRAPTLSSPSLGLGLKEAEQAMHPNQELPLSCSQALPRATDPPSLLEGCWSRVLKAHNIPVPT